MEPSNENKQDLIDRYFEGRLSDQDKLEFKKQLKDPDFKADFFFHKDMAEALHRDHQDPALKKIFQEREKKIKDRFRIRRQLAMAASVLVLIVAGTLILPRVLGEEDSNLHSSIFSLKETPDAESGTKSAEVITPDENPNRACIDQYFTKDFSGAISCFQNRLNTNPENIQAQYFLGHCYFAEKNYTAAIQQFDTILKDTEIETNFKQEVVWNRLLNLKMLNDARYIDELEKILQDDRHRFFRKAKKLKALG